MFEGDTKRKFNLRQNFLHYYDMIACWTRNNVGRDLISFFGNWLDDHITSLERRPGGQNFHITVARVCQFLQVLGTCDPYNASTVVFQSLNLQ